MTAVKICGICTIEHALAAAAAGADFVGLVFAPSRRQITLEQAATIAGGLRRHAEGQRVRLVGLFVNERVEQINAVIEHCDLDYIQLSGDETPQQARGIARPVIKSLRLAGTPEEAAWLALFEQRQARSAHQQDVVNYHSHAHDNLLTAPCPLLVDAHVPGTYGGTGILANWEHAGALARRQALILAGGLTPANVAAAIAQVRPWGVDVSSGVETNGVKDSAKIHAFIAAVRTMNG